MPSHSGRLSRYSRTGWYARFAATASTIIVGSTNSENGFLRDVTGNRRFWPVRVGRESRKKPWEITEEEIWQIWAEAVSLYRSGEKLYLEGEEAQIAIAEQAEAMETDDREASRKRGKHTSPSSSRHTSPTLRSSA